MPEEKTTADRLAAYSDAVFAVIVTIMVLELRAPDQPAFSALRPLWPTAISYAVSYLFIAIIWINHHYLMRFVGPPTLRFIWINFVHLFMVSLLPFANGRFCYARGSSGSFKVSRRRPACRPGLPSPSLNRGLAQQLLRQQNGRRERSLRQCQRSLITTALFKCFASRSAVVMGEICVHGPILCGDLWVRRFGFGPSASCELLRQTLLKRCHRTRGRCRLRGQRSRCWLRSR